MAENKKRKRKPHKNNLKKNLVQSPDLTRERLDRLIAMCAPDERKVHIIMPHVSELIPPGDFNLNQQLAFLICAIPSVGRLPDETILATLLMGPTVRNPANYPGTKRNILRALKEKHPETAKVLAERYRPHKHVPEDVKANDDWCCLLAFGNMIDQIPGPWMESGDPDMIHDAVCQYLRLTERNFGPNANIDNTITL